MRPSRNENTGKAEQAKRAPRVRRIRTSFQISLTHYTRIKEVAESRGLSISFLLALFFLRYWKRFERDLARADELAKGK